MMMESWTLYARTHDTATSSTSSPALWEHNVTHSMLFICSTHTYSHIQELLACPMPAWLLASCHAWLAWRYIRRRDGDVLIFCLCSPLILSCLLCTSHRMAVHCIQHRSVPHALIHDDLLNWCLNDLHKECVYLNSYIMLSINCNVTKKRVLSVLGMFIKQYRAVHVKYTWFTHKRISIHVCVLYERNITNHRIYSDTTMTVIYTEQ